MNKAIDKVTVEMLETLEPGESVNLGEEYNLYRYIGDFQIGSEDETDFYCVRETATDEEVLCVQWDIEKRNGIVFTEL